MVERDFYRQDLAKFGIKARVKVRDPRRDLALSELDKVQVVDGVWENREKRQEEPFLSLRLMHAEETHLLLALNDGERRSLLAFADAVTAARHPER